MEDDREQLALGDEAPELTEQRFAVNLRVFREERGMSQGRLAEEMAARGWPWRQQTVTRVETGRRMVRLGEAKAVAEILETSLDMLTMRTDEARIIEHLADLIRKVKISYRWIAGWTNELLRAREELRVNPFVVTGGAGESSRVQQMAAEARDMQRLAPEAAVAQGIALTADVKQFFGQDAELVTFWPRSIADAGVIAEALRTGQNIAVDLTQAPEADGQRIRDFLDGATRVRGGIIKQVDEMKYRVMPAAANEQEWAISATRGTLADAAPGPVSAQEDRS